MDIVCISNIFIGRPLDLLVRNIQPFTRLLNSIPLISIAQSPPVNIFQPYIFCCGEHSKLRHSNRTWNIQCSSAEACQPRFAYFSRSLVCLFICKLYGTGIFVQFRLFCCPIVGAFPLLCLNLSVFSFIFFPKWSNLLYFSPDKLSYFGIRTLCSDYYFFSSGGVLGYYISSQCWVRKEFEGCAVFWVVEMYRPRAGKYELLIVVWLCWSSLLVGARNPITNPIEGDFA